MKKKTAYSPTLNSIRQTDVDTLMIRTQSRVRVWVRVRVRVSVGVRVRVSVIYLNQTGFRHQILGGVKKNCTFASDLTWSKNYTIIIANTALHFVLIIFTRNSNSMFASHLQVKQIKAVITLYLPSRKYHANANIFAQIITFEAKMVKNIVYRIFAPSGKCDKIFTFDNLIHRGSKC